VLKKPPAERNRGRVQNQSLPPQPVLFIAAVQHTHTHVNLCLIKPGFKQEQHSIKPNPWLGRRPRKNKNKEQQPLSKSLYFLRVRVTVALLFNFRILYSKVYGVTITLPHNQSAPQLLQYLSLSKICPF
jgi:hypothetical protein